RDALLHERQVPVLLLEVCLRCRDVRGEPATVGDRDEEILLAVPQLDWQTDVLDGEAPRLVECEVVVAPARDALPGRVSHVPAEVLAELPPQDRGADLRQD